MNVDPIYDCLAKAEVSAILTEIFVFIHAHTYIYIYYIYTYIYMCVYIYADLNFESGLEIVFKYTINF